MRPEEGRKVLDPRCFWNPLLKKGPVKMFSANKVFRESYKDFPQLQPPKPVNDEAFLSWLY